MSHSIRSRRLASVTWHAALDRARGVLLLTLVSAGVAALTVQAAPAYADGFSTSCQSVASEGIAPVPPPIPGSVIPSAAGPINGGMSADCPRADAHDSQSGDAPQWGIQASTAATSQTGAEMGMLHAYASAAVGLIATSAPSIPAPFDAVNADANGQAAFTDTVTVGSQTLAPGTPVTVRLTQTLHTIATSTGGQCDGTPVPGKAFGTASVSATASVDNTPVSLGDNACSPGPSQQQTQQDISTPVGASLSIAGQISVSADARSVPSNDPTGDVNEADASSEDASDTAGTYLDIVTPGATLTSASGHDYSSPASGEPPSAPSAPSSNQALNNNGNQTISWTAATDPAGLPITYTLQHRNNGDSWTDVANGLTGTSYAFGQDGNPSEGEGTWSYRVRATDSTPLSSGYAEADNVVVVDKTAPTAPTLTADAGLAQSPSYTDSSGITWYKRSELIDVTDSGDPALADGSLGSGVDPGWFPTQISATIEGPSTASETVEDFAGNRSSPGTLSAHVDAQPPAVSIGLNPGSPDGNNGWYRSPPALTVSATDSGSGVADVRCELDPAAPPATLADIPGGCAFNGGGQAVTQDGAHTMYAAAVDHLGNVTSVHRVVFKLDSTPPQIAFAGDGSYTVDQQVTVTCTASDPLPAGAPGPASGLAADPCSTPLASGPAYTFQLGANVVGPVSANDEAGNAITRSTTFTVHVDPGSLCTLTKQFIQSSAKYQSLSAPLRAAIDATATAICNKPAQIVPNLSPALKTTLINGYKIAVGALVQGGWLTTSQAAILTRLVGAL